MVMRKQFPLITDNQTAKITQGALREVRNTSAWVLNPPQSRAVFALPLGFRGKKGRLKIDDTEISKKDKEENGERSGSLFLLFYCTKFCIFPMVVEIFLEQNQPILNPLASLLLNRFMTIKPLVHPIDGLYDKVEFFLHIL
jgi:hypothetical protein